MWKADKAVRYGYFRKWFSRTAQEAGFDVGACDGAAEDASHRAAPLTGPIHG